MFGVKKKSKENIETLHASIIGAYIPSLPQFEVWRSFLRPSLQMQASAWWSQSQGFDIAYSRAVQNWESCRVLFWPPSLVLQTNLGWPGGLLRPRRFFSGNSQRSICGLSYVLQVSIYGIFLDLFAKLQTNHRLHMSLLVSAFGASLAWFNLTPPYDAQSDMRLSVLSKLV